MPPATKSPAWQALAEHQAASSDRHVRDLFAADPARFDQWSFELDGLLLDLSKNNVTGETAGLLLALAEAAEVTAWRDRLFAGGPVNGTEGRAALHMALRAGADTAYAVDGTPVGPTVQATLDRMAAFAAGVHQGDITGADGRAFTDLIAIGIGGSDLGPRLACRALAPHGEASLRTHFVANVDAADLAGALEQCDPRTTLVSVASKTFTTQETLTNAMTARRWITEDLGSEAVAQHFLAMTANPDMAAEFGIADDRVFPMWDWVGGRFSLWSAIGLPAVLGLGMPAFRELLAGARAMDEHFRDAPPGQNMPILLALIGIWNRNFQGCASHAILPYGQLWEHLPVYLQQLEMESLGKAVDRDGRQVHAATAPVLFGQPGTIGQHAFYQLLHQGTDLISSDFIAAARDPGTFGDHHDKLLANFLAQGTALMAGRRDAELAGEDPALRPHKAFAGNRPVTTILLDDLEPRQLGMLLALYEHKVFVQGVIWGLNPFDQFGVELGKTLATPLVRALGSGQTPEASTGLDGSTLGLLSRILAYRDNRP